MSMNTRRIEYAAIAIDAMLDTTNEDHGDDIATPVTDLLANLMHYCDAEGIDFQRCLKSAGIHFEAERYEDA